MSYVVRQKKQNRMCQQAISPAAQIGDWAFKKQRPLNTRITQLPSDTNITPVAILALDMPGSPPASQAVLRVTLMNSFSVTTESQLGPMCSPAGAITQSQ